MNGMISVRFGRDMFTAVKHFARRDGVTVSDWIRKLVEKELKSQNRQPPADLWAYPRTYTMPSGCSFKFNEPPTRTGL